MFKMTKREGKKRIKNFENELNSDRTDPSEWCLALCCVCPPIGLPALIIYYITKKFKKKSEYKVSLLKGGMRLDKKILGQNDFSTIFIDR